MDIRCSKCDTVKSEQDFHNNSTRKNGKQAHCKICRAATTRNYKVEYQRKRAKGMSKEERITRREYAREIRRKHPWKKRYYESIRRARKLQATPPWACLDSIKEFYKNCPEGYEVDHIYPLLGTECSGLHVVDNLQYLTTSENRRKSNRMPEIYNAQ